MTKATLSTHFERGQQRLDRLRERIKHLPDADTTTLEAVEDLSQTLEEFGVSLEQLTLQREELSAAHSAASAASRQAQSLFNLAPDSYVVTDTKGVILDANHAAEARFGRNGNYLRGKPLLVLLDRSDAPKLKSLLSSLPAPSGVSTSSEELYFAPEGAPPFWGEVRVGIQQVVRRERPLLLWIIRDITERRQLALQLRAASNAAIRAQEEERKRIARDLHDNLGQILTLASLKMSEARQAQDSALLSEVENLLGQAHVQARSLTNQLSPMVLHDMGLVAAVEWFASVMQRRYGVLVTVHDDGQPKNMSDLEKAVLFRSIRECLINVAKHAGTKTARIRIWRHPKEIGLVIEDDGKGFCSSEQTSGFGLLSIQEQLTEIGGQLTIDAAPGAGARISMILPIKGSLGESSA